jgi:hypothetical protein
MPLNFPSSPVNGDTYTDTNGSVWRFDGVKWDVITNTAKRLFSGARVVLGSNFALTETPTAINGGVTASIPFDTDQYFRNATPTRIIAPQNGFYRINIVLTSANVGDGASYTVALKRNGSFTITTNDFGANQSIVFDEVLQLNANDYVEVYASDSLGSGYIATGSFIEINLLGLAVGTGISSFNAFSGVRTLLSSAFSASSTNTAVSWSDTSFDQNADVLGSEYWSELNTTRLTIKVTGYYRVRSFVETNNVGTENSYTVSLKKNGTTILETINMSANDFVLLNNLYILNADDYLELIISNSGNSGAITTESYLELSRQGV